MTIDIEYKPSEYNVIVRTGSLYGSASELVASLAGSDSLNEYLWDKTVELSQEVPFIFQSKYHALSGAAEEIAYSLTKTESESFLAYARNRYRGQSNYAGD